MGVSYTDDIEGLKNLPPPFVRSFEFREDGLSVHVRHPVDTVVEVMLSEGYQENYPEGDATALINGEYEELGCGRLGKLLDRIRIRLEYLNKKPDSDGDMSSDMEDLTPEPSSEMDAMLQSDIASLEEMTEVLLEQHVALDSVTITFSVDISFLPPTIRQAWDLSKQPIKVKLQCSRSQYRQAPNVKVECYQEGDKRCGILNQMQSILRGFVSREWKMIKSVNPNLRTLVDMGFDTQEASKALEVCNGDLDRATSLLLDTPDALEQIAPTNDGTDETDKAMTMSAHRLPDRTPPPPVKGFLVQLHQYTEKRLPTCASFCVICDKPHIFLSGMIKPSVCTRDICAFAFQQMGVGADSAEGITTSAGVVDLLVVMAKAAAHSSRWSVIFDPYPLIFDDKKNKVFDPKKKDIGRLRETMDALPDPNMVASSHKAKAWEVAKQVPWALELFDWIVQSNRSQLIKIGPLDIISGMNTPHQFLLISDAPEKQAKFDQLRKRYPTEFAFHGSGIENWHSILRNGLFNASGTKLQMHGAAYGSGIYLSPETSVSFGYSNITVGGSSKSPTPESSSLEYLKGDVRCIAICEVIDHELSKTGSIWVQPNPDYVVTRFFFVYDSQYQPKGDISTLNAPFRRELEAVLRNFQT